MKIYSYMRNGFELTPVEVEIGLVPGVPKIHFIGQPDNLIRESEMRIKSAIKHQGFHFPKGQQIIVNLKPSYVKKTSQGIDLAVACGLLIKTEQIDNPFKDEKSLFIYGGLSLDGGVEVPDDLDFLLPSTQEGKLLSGVPQKNYSIPIWALKELKSLTAPQLFEKENRITQKMRPPLNDAILFSEEEADLLSIVALGEHSILLAGAAGSGKTTFAQNLFTLLREPSDEQYLLSQQINKVLGQDIQWRPFVSPHHSITPISMIGGGVPIFPGEITRAHGGMLLLDELLEFKNEVKEALREPIESGQITVSRKGVCQKFPADIMLVATTNLCPCGDLIPGKPSSCRYSLWKCRSYSENLSGPLLDRFQILAQTHEWSKNKVISLLQIQQRIKKAEVFAKNNGRGDVLNGKLNSRKVDDIINSDKKIRAILPDLGVSHRRRQALIKTARTIADLDESSHLKPIHIEKASRLCVYPFALMKKLFN